MRAGRLYPKYRGVYAYGHPQLSREGEWMAGVLAGGDGAALAGRCATALLRLTTWVPREVEIVVPKRRRPQPGLRVRTCRRLDPRDITVVNGIPVTTVARLLVDLTEDSEPDELANLIHEAAHSKKFNLAATRAAMERANGRRHLKVLEAAIELHLSGSAGTRSRLERRFRKLVVGAGLPDPRMNTIVNGFEVDAHWPGVCVEIDGPGHRRARSKTDDRIRDAALRASGYVVIRFTEDDVEQRPEMILERLRQASITPSSSTARR